MNWKTLEEEIPEHNQEVLIQTTIMKHKEYAICEHFEGSFEFYIPACDEAASAKEVKKWLAIPKSE